MRELETASLGHVKKLGKSTVFYKALPSTLIHSEHHLGNLNVSLEEYKDNFLKANDLLTSFQEETAGQPSKASRIERIFQITTCGTIDCPCF